MSSHEKHSDYDDWIKSSQQSIYQINSNSELDLELESDYNEITHYRKIMCLKQTNFGPKSTESDYLEKSEKLPDRNNLKNLCVLPKGHDGICKHNFNGIFKKTEITENIKKRIDKILTSFKQKIYDTPGNDDFVYKNRANRLYSNVLSDNEQRKIRNKAIKKKCAIPLKDATTPELGAHASLDWMTFIISMECIKDENLINDEYMTEEMKEYFQENKEYMIKYYKKFKRKIFDVDGNTICCITRIKFQLNDIADLERDIRYNPLDNDLQLGHNIPRSDKCITIRGCNLLPMTRRGNNIIGENKFTEDKWLIELSSIINPY
jgi:hypothetical protein